MEKLHNKMLVIYRRMTQYAKTQINASSIKQSKHIYIALVKQMYIVAVSRPRVHVCSLYLQVWLGGVVVMVSD